MKRTKEQKLIGILKRVMKSHPYPYSKVMMKAKKDLDKITGKDQGTYYQPKFDEEGNVVGDEYNTCYTFQVWRKKKNLMQEYPNCTPVKYSGGDIEEPTFMD